MGRKTDATQDAAPQSAEVALTGPRYDTEDLSNIQSFDDAVRLAQEVLGAEALVTADGTLGDGFAVVDNKDQLIGVPFIILSMSFTLGDHGEFAVARLVTRDGKKLVLTDGSTGVYAQLLDFSNKSGKMGGLLCRHGLRRSDYTYTDADGQDKPAQTYYIDTTA